MAKDFLNTQFGIEIEFTGISRAKAADILAEEITGDPTEYACRTSYDARVVKDADGREWKIVYDASIRPEGKAARRSGTPDYYKVEFVSPILTYEKDMERLQKIIRAFRKAGGFTNETCGIHIHLNGADHTPRSVRNFINIIASHNDLLYDALQIKEDRKRYCKALDLHFLTAMARQKPQSMAEIENIWYSGYVEARNRHYHQSRYHFLNLHSFSHGHGTIELRCFNSTLHAGVVRSYVVLALALNHQALTAKSARASVSKVQQDNPKFAMRTYLNRLGLIGEEFKNCRMHLIKHLPGNAAWRSGLVGITGRA